MAGRVQTVFCDEAGFTGDNMLDPDQLKWSNEFREAVRCSEDP